MRNCGLAAAYLSKPKGFEIAPQPDKAAVFLKDMSAGILTFERLKRYTYAFLSAAIAKVSCGFTR